LDSPATAFMGNTPITVISNNTQRTLGIHDILNLPNDSCYHNLLSLPLFTAGAELDRDSSFQGQKVRERFQNLFSSTRLPANIRAVKILEETWAPHDNGHDVFWLYYRLETSQFLILCCYLMIGNVGRNYLIKITVMEDLCIVNTVKVGTDSPKDTSVVCRNVPETTLVHISLSGK
jgi:hypothetical protein